MNTSSPIIAGIDFSDSSPLVIRHAIRAAALAGATVIAIHVIPASRLADRLASGYKAASHAELQAAGLEKLKALVAAEDPSGSVRLEVREGRPVDAINQLIKESGAELLVIAANDLTRKRLGSVASLCVRTSPCDVLVLRDWQGGDFSKVLVCTDFSESAGHALERAAHLSRGHNAKLEIVHVIYPPSRDVWGEVLDDESESPESYVEKCGTRINDKMRDFLERHASAIAGLNYQTTVLESVLVTPALTYQILDGDADLVVLGTRGHTRLGGFFLGTNAERLIQDAPVSVLAVRGGG
jgi:nucleotide-binding universal stress UspA family protein